MHPQRFINPQLWISNLPNFGDTVISVNIDMGSLFSIFLGLFLMIISDLGYSFYLWYLNTSPDQVQRRLLNILYGYLSLICLGGTLSSFTIIVCLTFPLGEQTEAYQFNTRVSVALVCGLSLSFLLISFATLLNHFKPNLYLEISLRWKNKIAIPVILVILIVVENMLRLPCVGSKNMSDCEFNKMRVNMSIPATAASFICQLVVIVDDLWGLKKVITTAFNNMCKKPNSVSPENNLEIPIPEVNQFVVIIDISQS